MQNDNTKLITLVADELTSWNSTLNEVSASDNPAVMNKTMMMEKKRTY